MACNLNCHVETEGLFTVTDSQVHGKRGNSSEVGQVRDVVTTGHIQEVIFCLSNGGNSDDLE